MKVFIDAVGLASPGLIGWQTSKPVLAGSQPFEPSPLEKYKPTQLPANEARRATELVRMAFRVCEDLMANSKTPLNECASVFSSAGGDYPIIDQICKSLCEPERLVSPTQFHNSVHNSAAGYWSIATGSRQASNSLAAGDHSFGAGLLEAASFCVTEQLPTLLVVYDIKPPYPLSDKIAIPVEFGVGLLLSPVASENSLADVILSQNDANGVSPCKQSNLESLRQSNPAAQSLPLLELLASNIAGDVYITYGDQKFLSLAVKPWA